jgi:glucose/arabinose dehydrogenase
MQLQTRVSRFTVSGNPVTSNVADDTTEFNLLTVDQPFDNHNGGDLHFGPDDGLLYIALGDGGSGGDPGDRAQDPLELLGKMLRLDVDLAAPHIPPSNPFVGDPSTLDEIFSLGLRNPWRFSFDRMTGDLYIGDVGQGAWEEVDVETKGDGNKNYGWKIAEGNHCRPGQANCDMTDLDALVGAVDEYAHADGDDCVVGGYVYRGSGIPSLQGWYVYGDNGPGRKIRAFVWDGEGRCGDRTIVLSERDNINLSEDITSFGEDANGELYVTTSSNVYRIDAQ